MTTMTQETIDTSSFTEASLQSMLTELPTETKVIITSVAGKNFGITKVTTAMWQDDQSNNQTSSEILSTNLLTSNKFTSSLVLHKPKPFSIDSPDELVNFLHSKGPHSLGYMIGKSFTDNSFSFKYQTNIFGHLYTEEEVISKAADPDHTTVIDAAIALIDKAKKELTLDRSTKVISTKMQKRLVDFKAYLAIAQTLHSGKSVPPFTYISWGTSSEFPARIWPFDLSSLHHAMMNKNAELQFKEASKDLGFDPYKGTTEQYISYIKTVSDDDWVEHISEEHAKIYALHLMKAPNKGMSSGSIAVIKIEAVQQSFAAKASVLTLTLRDAANGKNFPPASAFETILSYTAYDAMRYLFSTEYAGDYPKVEFPFNKYENMLSEKERSFMPAWLPAASLRLFSLPEDSGHLSGYGNNAYARRVVAILMRSGIWYKGTTYTSDHNNVVTFPLSPGTSVYQWNNDTDVYVFVPKFTKPGTNVPGFDHAGSGTWNSYQFDDSSFTLKYAAPSKVTFSDAEQFDQNFDPALWDSLVKEEKSIVVPTELSGTEAIAVKKSLIAHGDSRKPIEFPYKVQALILSNSLYTPLVIFKFDLGHYDPANNEEADWDDFTAEHPEFAAITDITDENQINLFVKATSNVESTLMLSTLGVVNYYAEDDVLGAKFSLREALVNWKESNKPQAANISGMPPVGVLGSLKAIPSLNMGGQQKKTYFADANGDVYLGKPNNKDKFRPDSEQAANNIGRIFGFNVPDSALRIIDGDYTHVQKVIDNVTGNLVGVTPLSLDDQTLTAAMQSHVLDWAISNHDSSGINLLSDGVKFYKIDLGQAWKALGDDKLEAGWELPGNYGGVWYNDFYNAVKNNKVDQARLDKITKAVLTKARYISLYRDTEFKQNLADAFKNRTYYPVGLNKESFTDLAMARKSSTFTDFFLFYENLYSTSGYVFPFDVEYFDSTRLEGTDAHLTVSEEFASEVLKNKIFGKSLMLGDPEVEDAHAFFYTIKNNKTIDLRGELKVRNEADKILDAWITSHLSSGFFEPEVPKPVKKSGQISLPNTETAHTVLVGFAKNTNYHYSDHAYNSNYTNAANEQILWLNDAKAAITASSTSAIKFPSEHMKEVWLMWADDMLGHFQTVKNAVTNHSKVPQMPSSTIYTPPSKVDKKPVKKAPEPPKATNSFVVKQGTFSTPKTTAAGEDGLSTYQGEQQHSGMNSYFITSTAYPNIKIQYVPHKFSGFGPLSGNFSNRGRIQITVENWDGSSNTIEEALNFLREMGLELQEATEETLEAFFWQHLANILKDRKLDAAESKALNAISYSKDVEVIKAAFSTLWGKNIVETADWRPHFSDFRAHIIEDIEDEDNKPKSGRPYWMRPDFDMKKYSEAAGGVLPSRQDGSVTYLINGGYCANEEKIRFTGAWGLKSNSPDADRRRGSGQFAFMRQGQFIGSNGFYIEPHVMGRTSNYSYKSDTYGDTSMRSGGSPFSITGSAAHGSGNTLSGFSKPYTTSTGSNEVMIKYGWSTWDDIAIISAESPNVRKTIIDFYKKKGITEIRGLPLEDRVVYGIDSAKATMAKIWKMYIQ